MANESLRRVNTSGGNRRVWTWAAWLKRSNITPSGNVCPFSGANPVFNTSGQQELSLLLGTGDDFSVYFGTSGVSIDGTVTPTQRFRDSGNWFHLIVAFDSTKVTSADRVKIYLNGNLITDLSASSYPSRNYDTAVNRSGFTINVGGKSASGNEWLGEMSDVFFVDGQALTPDVFGFYKQGKGYISVGSTQATDFRPGQWVPKTPRVIKTEINRRGGFGVNGFYLPMNDSRNFGADFHGDPNSIITLNEKLPQPRVGVATTASVGLGYTDALRADPYAANLVLALPFVSSGLCTNGTNVGVNTGFGDYSHIIRGSGSSKVAIITAASSTLSIASTAGYYGSAVSFNGNAGTGVSFASNSDFGFGTGDYTVECWVYKNSSSNTSESIWSVGEVNLLGSLTLSYESSNIWVRSYGTSDPLYVNDILVPWATLFPARQWNHIAVCRKGTTTTLFSNGVAVGVGTVNSPRNIATNPFVIGSLSPGGGYPFNGYIQDLRIYKGVAKYTGGFDVPRPYTPVGIATWRAVPDTTANNFATLNRLYNSVSGNVVLADGNLTYTGSQGSPNYGMTQGTIGVSTSKWYWEVRVGTFTPSIGVGVVRSGVSTSSYTVNPEDSFVSGVDGGIAFFHSIANTVYYWSGAISSLSYTIPSCTTGDVISVALDLTGGTNSKIYFAKNGTWGASGDPATGTNPVGLVLSGTYLPAISIGAAGASTAYLNFGQNPTFSGNTTAGTFTDSNGKGLFKYQPPSGFLALCEDNLPTPAIADPGKYFKTVLYTGTSASRNIVGVGFTPDLVWIKERNGADNHRLVDSVRGPIRELYSSLTNAEAIDSGGVLSFDSDGFSLGNGNSYNEAGINHVSWCWRAGAGTTSTNTNGSITSVVSVNQDAGFSIVSWSGTGSVGTIGHGLGKTPAFRINKYRDSSTNWYVWHKSLAANEFLILNQTTAKTGSSSLWNNTLPTSTTISYTTATTGDRFIEYVWAEIEGFSKFGSWVSNANADGPFIYCGFKPALVICKTASGDVSNWVIADSSRSSVNDGSTSSLRANTSDTEATAAGGFTIDFLSNGFKLRQSGALNSTGLTNIFAAWAESPFTTANAK